MQKKVAIKVFASLILALLLIAPFSVYADDYDYEFENYNIDPWQFNAYRYWLMNGYELSNVRTYSSSVSELLSFGNVTFNSEYVDSNLPVKITVPSHYITGSSTNSSSAYPQMFCKYFNNILPGSTQEDGQFYSCRLTESAYTETVQNLDNLDFTVTDLNAQFTSTLQSRFYTYLNYGQLDTNSSYIGYTAYDSNSASTFSVGDTDMYFMIRPNVLSMSNANISVFPQANFDGNYSVSISNLGYYSGLTLFRIRLTTDKLFTGNLSIGRLVGRSETIYPIYFGAYDKMPDSVYEFIYGNRYVPILNQLHEDNISIINAINGTNDATTDAINSSTSSVNSSASDLNDTFNDIETIDSSLATDFNSALNGIDLETNDNILVNSNLVTSLNWIKDTYAQFLTAMPLLQPVIVFVLSLGIGLTLIGRLKL